jgi:hypothetical protein
VNHPGSSCDRARNGHAVQLHMAIARTFGKLTDLGPWARSAELALVWWAELNVADRIGRANMTSTLATYTDKSS